MTNQETLIRVNRRTPWGKAGKTIETATSLEEALEIADLAWTVEQKEIFTDSGKIENYVANVKSTDKQILGIVSNKYQVVNNFDSFNFCDTLLDYGMKFVSAGSIGGGRICWISAKLPDNYVIQGERIAEYILFMTSHDSSCSIKACIIPLRLQCSNSLSIALRKAQRSWSIRHCKNAEAKLAEARQTLLMSENYMNEFTKTVEDLNQIKLSENKVLSLVKEIHPLSSDMSDQQQQNAIKLQTELKERFYDAPDLQHLDMNGWRFINAISAQIYHGTPLRETKTYHENLLKKTMDGHPVLDRAYQMVLAAA